MNLLPANLVFPTCVGVDRRGSGFSMLCRGIPHVRGGGPIVNLVPSRHMVYSPRAWGWTGEYNTKVIGTEVFPTCVGVDRGHAFACVTQRRIPHVRGGGPEFCATMEQYRAYSPRAWGWTVIGNDAVSLLGVFPTCVGVDRS